MYASMAHKATHFLFFRFTEICLKNMTRIWVEINKFRYSTYIWFSFPNNRIRSNDCHRFRHFFKSTIQWNPYWETILTRGHPPLKRPLDNVNLNINVLISTPDERPPLLKCQFSGAKGVAPHEGFYCLWKYDVTREKNINDIFILVLLF